MSSIIKHTFFGTLLVAASGARVAAQTQAGAASIVGPVPITFFGEVRTRSEWNEALTSAPADAFTGLRSRLGVRIDASPGARIVLQLQDSRVLGAEGNTSPTAAAMDVFDLHQGYLELNGTLGASTSSSLRAGRQEIALGNERLVGSVGWSITGRSFDGVRWLVSGKNAAGAELWSASAFAAVVEQRGGQFTTTAPSEDHAAGALYVRRTLPGAALIDATLLYDRGMKYGSFLNSNRATLDARIVEPNIGDVLRVELEGAYQGGTQLYAPTTGAQVNQTVGAWLAGARIGTPTIDPRHASETVGVDVLSGDASPNDGRYTAFSTMYATNHPFYGLMDLIADPATTTKYRGLVDAFAIDSRRLGGPVGFRAELHDFTIETGSNRSLGTEGDVAFPIRVNGAATVDVGYSLFRASSGASAIGLGARGSTAQWAYVQMTVGF